jgi:1,4-dihydroxy-2-naphthoate polyprenyltransferase
MASMVLGAFAAAHDGPLALGWLTLTVVAILSVEVAKNASGEVVDFDSGADLAVRPEDRSPFSGGKRVIVDGILTRSETIAVAAVFYTVAVGIGAVIVLGRSREAFWFALAGLALAYFYHSPPLSLSYRGLGELAVVVTYGPLICAGTYLVQRGYLSARPVWASLPLGLLIGAFLWINEFPDYRADLESGKRNLVVRMGRPAASRTFAAIVAAAFLILALLPLVDLPLTLWLAMFAAPPASRAAWTLIHYPEDTPRTISAQGQTLITFLLYAAGSAIGLLLGR